MLWYSFWRTLAWWVVPFAMANCAFHFADKTFMTNAIDLYGVAVWIFIYVYSCKQIKNLRAGSDSDHDR